MAARSVLAAAILVLLANGTPALRGEELDDKSPSVLCDNEGCDSCDAMACDVCPRWTVRADAVFLQRETPNAQALVTDSFSSGGNTLLGAEEFKFRMAAGFALDVIRHNVRGTGWDLEAAFLDVDSFVATRDPIHSPNGAVTQFENPMGNTHYPADISGVYHSQIRSVELNARRSYNDWLTLLGGFRYMDLRERGLQVTHDILAAPTNRAIIDVQATNYLAGAQLGFDALVLQRNRIEINTLVKGGVYSNAIGNSTLITQNTGPSFASIADTTHTSFAADLQLAATYHVTKHFSARGGYQALWVSEVALAPNQVAVSDPLNGAAAVDASGSVFYHGLFVGLEYRR